MIHPIIKELQRQKDQGFYEAKKGVIRPFFNFSINLENNNGHIGNVQIERGSRDNTGGIAYRIPTEKDYPRSGWDRDGRCLLNYPISVYAPMHKIVDEISRIIGKEGKSFYSIYEKTSGDDGDGWTWIEKQANSLEEALEKYRFAKFEHNSPNGKIEFFSADDPGIITGKLRIEIPLTKIDEMGINKITAIAESIEKLN